MLATQIIVKNVKKKLGVIDIETTIDQIYSEVDKDKEVLFSCAIFYLNIINVKQPKENITM